MPVEFKQLSLDAELGALACSAVRGADPSYVAEWNWTYRDNPAGSYSFAAIDGDEIVAHYGLVARRVWVGGKQRRFGEVSDAFESRPGHMALVAQGLADARGGPKEEALFYDVPSRSGIALATRMLRFEVVQSETVLTRRLTKTAMEAPDDVIALERFGEDARWLYDRCVGEFAASAVRDAEYLNWRFVDRPGGRYTKLGVRDDAGVLRGFAVTSKREDDVALVDWLVPPDEPEVGEALMRAALARAASVGSRALTVSVPPWSPWFDRFQRWGFRAHATGRALVARAFVRRYDDLWLRDGWWVTMADSIAD